MALLRSSALHLTFLPVTLALTAACSSGDGGTGGTGGAGGSTSSTSSTSSSTSSTSSSSGSTTVCSCDISATQNNCAQFEGTNPSITTYCATHKMNCMGAGGTYLDAACPTANALGTCAADPAKFPAGITNTTWVYSGPPTNLMTSDEAKSAFNCDPPKVWTAKP